MPNDCDSPLPELAHLGIERFNKGAYWLAHEALEDAWNAEPAPIREFYRGILQAAVVYHHISQQNFRGALKVYQRSQKWLKPLPEICQGVDIARLRADLDAAIVEARRLGAENLAEFDLYPKIIFTRPLA
ncbi:MAG: DUF309 domain-containing protein [Anaerolineae bacterium]|jgi:uncharacterized protein|nr:DUF309 domain-containing protein [Anaerolineae bacterium]MBT7071065.1 DUF309 domain-containing protein [Anaerolineae bacterium]MBT7323771.1 DUF309 domain-containing protein [Anaerolineae bacterium]